MKYIISAIIATSITCTMLYLNYNKKTKQTTVQVNKATQQVPVFKTQKEIILKTKPLNKTYSVKTASAQRHISANQESRLLYEQQAQDFANHRKKVLQNHLKDIQQDDVSNIELKKQQRLSHEKQARDFEQQRKEAFVNYKKEFKKHKQNQDHVLKQQLQYQQDLRQNKTQDSQSQQALQQSQ